MVKLSTRARAAAHWLLAALFTLFGIWTLGQWWTMLDASTTWPAQLIPMLATIGAVALVRREIHSARMRPAPVRLVRDRRR